MPWPVHANIHKTQTTLNVSLIILVNCCYFCFFGMKNVFNAVHASAYFMSAWWEKWLEIPWPVSANMHNSQLLKVYRYATTGGVVNCV